MRKTWILFLVLVLMTGSVPAFAQDMAFADLRQLAPAGTFLNPGEQPISDNYSYKSENISITITEQRVENTNVYVADIYVASVRNLRRGLSHDAYGKQAQNMGTIAYNNNAILAMTGDYSHLFSKGLVVVNGQVIRKSANSARDNYLIHPDGTATAYKRKQMDANAVIQQPLWQSFLFGPSLLKEDGSPYDKFDSKIGVANPRSVIGYFGPGHYCFVLVDGRQKDNRGLAMVPLSKFMSQLGCKSAYNLDGGQSAMLWFQGTVINTPYKGGRALTDIVYVGE